jgi:elongation factor Ts
MADVTASMVMELRGRTGLGMMECKKALTDTAGDMSKAEELLRIKSGAKASKAADRVATEGVIGTATSNDGKTAAMVELNSETDFVARNDDFIAFAKRLASLVIERDPPDVGALSALPLEGATVESIRQALVQKIGENISIRRFVRVSTSARLAQYLHNGSRIGATVAFEGGDDQTGKDLAMHVAAAAAPGATRPVAISRDEVPSEHIDKERSVYAAQAAESGKPPEIVAKMVEGRINKFLAEVTLLGQPFVKDPEQTVEKYVKAKGAKVKSFHLYVVGEGMEKKKDDFAAEVAAMAKT